MDPQQEDYLNFLIIGSPTIDPSFGYQLELFVKAYYDDGTNSSAVTATLDGIFPDEFPSNRLLQITAGPINSGASAITPSKKLVKYEVVLREQTGHVVISETRTYHVDQVQYPHRRIVMFLNSLGAWETLRFNGDTINTQKYSRDIARKYLKPGYAASDGEFSQGTVEVQNSRSMGSGYILPDGKEWQEYMRDMLRSPFVFDVTSGIRVPILVTATELPGTEDHNYKYMVRFDAIDAYADVVYTPDSVIPAP
ncbi:MAG: hypothetical protein WDO15_11485 [Bacteroidota bacterium]